MKILFKRFPPFIIIEDFYLQTYLHSLRIVVAYAKECNKTVEEALDYFYHSIVYTLMSKGISDMNCMSDAYLVEELILRENESNRTTRNVNLNLEG